MDPVSRAQSQTPSKPRKTGFRGGNPDVGKATQFKPGNPGGPGRPKKTPITKIFEELFESTKDREAIKKQIRRTLTKRGMAGVLLLREAAERMEGKVPQPVQVEGEITLTIAERMDKAEKRLKNAGR